MHIDQEGMSAPLEGSVGDIEEPDSPGAPKELAGCSRQVITVEAAEVDRHLADCLTCVDEEWYVGILADLTDSLYRLYQAGVRGNPGESDQRRATPGNQPSDGLGIDAAFRRIRCPHKLHASALRQREVHDLVRGVVRLAGDNQIVGSQIECAQRL